jgi:hypothetical protein
MRHIPGIIQFIHQFINLSHLPYLPYPIYPIKNASAMLCLTPFHALLFPFPISISIPPSHPTSQFVYPSVSCNTVALS